MVADRRRCRRLIVLVNPMVPKAGESPGQWWDATGQDQAMAEHFRRIGMPDKDFDPVEDFFHDVPARFATRRSASRRPVSPTPRSAKRGRWAGGRTCPPGWWRAATTGSSRWSFSAGWSTTGWVLDVDVLPGGHLMALSRPRELADYLLASASDL